MTFFIKILDGLNPEMVSGYTAWYVQNLMKRYSEKQINHMWRAIEE